jgi:hypothetical protein
MLISDAMRDMNRQLFDANPLFATSGQLHRAEVRPLADWGRKSILDYGAGRCTLAVALGPAYDVTNYDPALPELNVPPEPHDVVVCTDVLEHVEPECLDDVLKDLLRLTREHLFVSIAMKPSSAILADGRNAHLIIENKEWWKAKLEEAGFEIVKTKPLERTVTLIWYVCKPRAEHALQ